MAKGQYLSSYQKSIVNRYYQHADARVSGTLQELVSDLALAEPAKAEKLWKKAGETLAKLGVDPVKVQRSVGSKDVKAFATLVGELLAKPGDLGKK